MPQEDGQAYKGKLFLSIGELKCKRKFSYYNMMMVVMSNM